MNKSCRNNPTRVMGFENGSGAAGKFILKTASSDPFCGKFIRRNMHVN